MGQELLSNLGNNYTGAMEITSANAIHAVTLKFLINARGEPLLTTLPIADMTLPRGPGSVVFPQVAIGEGFSTRLILIKRKHTGRRSAVVLSFQRHGDAAPARGVDGEPLSLRNCRRRESLNVPGSTAGIANIVLLDPATYAPTSEVVVNKGGPHARNCLY